MRHIEIRLDDRDGEDTAGHLRGRVVPLSQAILLDINPTENHARAMAMFGMGAMVGPITDPTLGGYLTDYVSWRWAF